MLFRSVSQGLTGKQGVVIPRTNIEDLMLRADVIQAVEDKKFTIYAIDTIDDGVEILLGKKAGKLNAKGEYPKGTINYLVQSSLRDYFEKYKHYAKETHGGI